MVENNFYKGLLNFKTRKKVKKFNNYVIFSMKFIGLTSTNGDTTYVVSKFFIFLTL